MLMDKLLKTTEQTVSTMSKKNKLMIAIASVVVIAVIVMLICHYAIKNDTVIMQPLEVSDPVQVAGKLKVSPRVANDIVGGIQKAVAKPPVMSWAVQAKDTQEAAKIVEKQIENKTAPPLPPADKTIVTPQETKVDVYRIDLDADWEVGIGYGNHDGDSYIPIEIQRNYSKHKAIAAEVHMDMSLQKVKGYEIKHVWRF